MVWGALRDASFRGVRFCLENADGESGRRAIPRAFPKKEVGWTEDNGALSGSQQINAILVGKEYQTQLEALLAALNTPGPGELVHPWFGSQIVQIGKVSHRLSTQEGGIARVTFEVHEAGERLFPRAEENTEATVMSASEQLTAAMEDGDYFGVLDGLGDMLDTYLGDLESLIMNMPTFPPAAVAAWMDRSGKLRVMMDVAVAKPASLVSGIMGLVADMKNLVTEPFRAMQLYDQIASRWEGARAEESATHMLSRNIYSTPPVVYEGVYGFAGSVPTEIQEPTQAMLENIADFRLLGLVAALNGKAQTLATASVVPDLPHENSGALLHATSGETPAYQGAWTTSDELIATGDALAEQLASQAALAVESGQRDIWRALRYLRTAVLADVRLRATRMPEVTVLHVASTTSVAQLAWRETGNTENRDEIVARNRLRNPTFILPSTAIEVIGD
ncbi:Mu-like prophage DNA circulation protein [Pantoea sesami]|nr:Mu-like prophage DNA circulation protein [Pantoea sesami]